MRYKGLATALTVLLVLCATACSTSRKATEVWLTTDYTNLTDKHDSVIVIIRDTLREVLGRAKRQSRATTISIRENEQGDTLRVSTVTDRDRLRSRENRRTKQEQSQARLGYALQGGGNAKRNLRRVETVTVTRIDTVYIQKDSLSVENKKIGLSASADGGSKKSGFLTYVKWITALICAITVLIITIKVCLRRV